MMKYFAVILVSLFMTATSSNGQPVGGYDVVDLDHENQAAFKDVDWNGVKNGGFAYVTTTIDPNTGRPSTTVKNSKTPWSQSEYAKLSAYDSDYNAKEEDEKLTKEEQEKYDWLVANLSPPDSDTKKPAEKKKESIELNAEEQQMYDWLVNNLKPATPDNTQTTGTKFNEKPTVYNAQPSPNRVQWRPIFGNRPMTPTATDPSLSTGYKYPAAGSTQPASRFGAGYTHPTTTSSYPW